MSRQGEASRYVHNGSALALGGYLTHPISSPIPSQGACAAPSCGGRSSNTVENYDFEGLISFGKAKTECLANREEKDGKIHHYTLSTVTIDDLNILDVVTASRVTARLLAVASYPADGSGYSAQAESQEKAAPQVHHHKIPLRFSTVGSAFIGLRVPTLPDLVPLAVPKDRYELQDGRLPARHSLAGCPDGIPIGDFGTVYLAEFFGGPFSARLTMIRVALGCPVGGEAGFGEVKDGGADWP